MAKNKKKSVWLVAPIFAIIILAIAILVILAKGYRYTSYADGSKFIGSIDNGQPVSGKIKFSNGMTAIIDYENKKIEYSNGDVYVGDINIIYREGDGTLTFAGTKDVYQGGFQKNEIYGFGTYKYSDGSVFEGNFVNGQKNGYGKFTSSTGETFSGTYANDMRNGYGQYVSADGSYSYSGNFVDNVQNGQGTCTYANGDTYEGEFKNNERHGKGLYTWKNGESYSGNFINGSRDTRILDKDGNYTVDENGNYVHGEMATYTKVGGEIYTGYFENGYIKIIDAE